MINVEVESYRKQKLHKLFYCAGMSELNQRAPWACGTVKDRGMLLMFMWKVLEDVYANFCNTE